VRPPTRPPRRATLAGRIGDRFNRKALILGGRIFWSIVTIATALSTACRQLVLCRALEPLGETLYFPASMSMVSDYRGKVARSRAMGIHRSGVCAGALLAVVARAGGVGQRRPPSRSIRCISSGSGTAVPRRDKQPYA
jgi:MFS family permease